MTHVRFRQLIGLRRDPVTGEVIEVPRNIDQLFYHGRQVATISRQPGAPIGLLHGVHLSASQVAEISRAVEKHRGVAPRTIQHAAIATFEILDDETENL